MSNNEIDLSSPSAYAADIADTISPQQPHIAKTTTQHGEAFQQFIEPGTEAYDTAVSVYEAVEPDTRRCFENCIQAAYVGRGSDIQLQYCEGYADLSMKPVEHAWLLIENRVVEITTPNRRDRVVPPSGGEYYGVAYNPSEAIEAVDADGVPIAEV